MNQLIGTLSSGGNLVGSLSSSGDLIGALSAPAERETSAYEGSYEWTPTEDAQTIPIQGLRATEDITIDAIASDYVGSAITRRDSSDLGAVAFNVIVPKGY